MSAVVAVDYVMCWVCCCECNKRRMGGLRAFLFLTAEAQRVAETLMFAFLAPLRLKLYACRRPTIRLLFNHPLHMDYRDRKDHRLNLKKMRTDKRGPTPLSF
jgi:hypothetical protein